MKRRDEQSGSCFQLIPFLVVAVALAAAPYATASSDARADLQLVRPDQGSVVFQTWQEDDGRMTAVSKDGGKTWYEPRTMMDRIDLHAGLIIPGDTAPMVPESLAAGEGNRLFIVQFETQSLSEWRAQLRGMGVEVLKYLPFDSHIVRMASSLVSDVEAAPFVRWVGPYEPSYRTFPYLLDGFDVQNVMTRRYNLMTFNPGAQEKVLLAAEIAAVGGQPLGIAEEGYILEAMLTDAQVLQILSSNNLQWMDEWSAPEEDMDIGRAVAGADYLLGTPSGYDGSGVRAEVMDGGVDLDHPDLPDFTVPPGSDLIHGPAVSSGINHGTCTYGINFATGAGSAQATGMMPNAVGYFAYYAGLSASHTRYTHTSELVDPSLPYQCVYQSNSWGSSRTFFYTTISAEMDDIIWQYDFTIFQSQSNAGNQDSRPQAWAKNIVAVGGAYHYDTADPTNDRWNFGASIGPADDGRIKPDLTFYYDSIYTTDAEPGGYAAGNYTPSFGGTSGATPMVAGTSGLFFEMWADNVWGTAPGMGTVFAERPHFSTLKALLINTAAQYDWIAGGPNADIDRFKQGWGYPQAHTAYDRAPLTRVVNEDSVLLELEKDTYTAVVPAAQDALKVTMVYADRAGDPAATLNRINDVTLKVTAPDGLVYWGNSGLTSGLWSAPAGTADIRNTVENVFIQNPMVGPWEIEVEAVEVNEDVHIETPADDQDYALVVYGVTDLILGGIIMADGFEDGTTDAWSRVEP